MGPRISPESIQSISWITIGIPPGTGMRIKQPAQQKDANSEIIIAFLEIVFFIIVNLKV